MTVDPWLLEVFRCPVTRQRLRPLPPDELDELNERIRGGGVTDAGGEPVTKPLREALVTEDGTLVYRIDHRVDHHVARMVGELAIRREPPRANRGES